MRVVLATVGTRGDVQPMLALAQALVRAGHEALLACPASFAEWVRSYGIEHHELGEDLQALLAGAGPKPESSIRGMGRYFADQMAIQAPRLLELSRGADVILGTGMAWMVPSVAQKLGVPAFVLLPGIAAIPSRLHPPPLMPWFGLPSWVNGLLWWAYQRSTNGLMGDAVSGARRGLGLPPIGAFDEHLFVETPCIVAADEQIFPPDPAWNGRYPYVGFLFLDDPTPLAPELDAWLSEGEPPVFVGFGSMAGHTPERASALVHDAIRATGRRGLVLGGPAGSAPEGSSPDGFFTIRGAPFHKLFPRVAVAVHHGGSGTLALALRAGVPQVLLPMMLDQHAHAHSLVRAGLAPRAPTLAKVTTRTLAQSIERALALPAAPRLAAAERVARSDAAGSIIARLERLVSGTGAHQQ